MQVCVLTAVLGFRGFCLNAYQSNRALIEFTFCKRTPAPCVSRRIFTLRQRLLCRNVGHPFSNVPRLSRGKRPPPKEEEGETIQGCQMYEIYASLYYLYTFSWVAPQPATHKEMLITILNMPHYVCLCVHLTSNPLKKPASDSNGHLARAKTLQPQSYF
jgi:hypothetical protein